MSKRSKTDLLVRQRFQNPLPVPAFPPKLLTIKTDPSRYASYDFLVPLSMERMVPMIVDAEGGMHLDQNAVPGYWETSETSVGRSGRMAPDMESEAPEMDEDDLALLVDPSGPSPAAAGMLPANAGNNMDLIGSGGASTANTPADALERRRKQVAFVTRTVIKTASDASISKQEAQAIQRAASKVELTIEDQIQAITSTFSALDIPLSELRHPTKHHLEAVESFDVLPDEFLAANQYMLFKFSDNPNERRAGSSSQPESVSSGAASLGIFRPLESEVDESGMNRIGYFTPDDDDVASSYNQKRRDGRYVDGDILARRDTLDEEAATAGEEEEEKFGFRFVRDYDATRREARSEYIFTIQEAEEGEEQNNTEGHSKPKGAYYTPLNGHTLLRKRRARKGETMNDYSDLGIDFWGGILVSLGGKAAMNDEGEIAGRLEELENVLLMPDYNGPAIAGEGAIQVEGTAVANGQSNGTH